jgi:hypothetical protein
MPVEAQFAEIENALRGALSALAALRTSLTTHAGTGTVDSQGGGFTPAGKDEILAFYAHGGSTAEAIKAFCITHASAQKHWAEYLRQQERPGQGQSHVETRAPTQVTPGGTLP